MLLDRADAWVLGSRLGHVEGTPGLDKPRRTLCNALTWTFSVETMGLEPTTPCLQSRCSSQLSYVP